MKTNFISNFNLLLVVIILICAFISKFASVLIGARIGGMKIDRKAFAIASGLNARGATGIILAGIGLSYGLINEQLFVALFVMAVATSILAGPLMNLFLAEKKTIAVNEPESSISTIKQY